MSSGLPSRSKRCSWATTERSIRYHDEEWGRPVHDDRVLFEFLILEGAQAGLSWETVLQKRDRYRIVFDGFDPARIALYDEAKTQALLADPGIIRNKLKVASAVRNARAFLAVQDEVGSFQSYLWDWVDGEPVQGNRQMMSDIPASTPLSDRMSKDLKKRGFNFVGTTIVYAYLQAVGVVNDHLVSCPQCLEVQRMNRSCV